MDITRHIRHRVHAIVLLRLSTACVLVYTYGRRLLGTSAPNLIPIFNSNVDFLNCRNSVEHDAKPFKQPSAKYQPKYNTW